MKIDRYLDTDVHQTIKREELNEIEKQINVNADISMDDMAKDIQEIDRKIDM
jgi:hypothetical protein